MMNRMDNRVQVAVGKIAVLSRKRQKDTAPLKEARRELQVARLERSIRNEIEPPDPYEPLPEEDRRYLADILLAGRYYFRKK